MYIAYVFTTAVRCFLRGSMYVYSSKRNGDTKRLWDADVFVGSDEERNR